jgi:o-succinylbenzoate synthase
VSAGSRIPAGIDAILVRIPFRRPMATSAGIWSQRESWIVRLCDANGMVGLGEAALDFGAEEAEAAAAELARLVRETVEGVRAGGRLPAGAELEASGAAGRALRCALDSSSLDLRLKEAPWPGRARSVPVNATIGFLAVEETVTAARAAVDAGFGTLKLKGGPERNTDAIVARVAAVRDAVGPHVRLRLDVNGAWNVATAQERIAALIPFGLEYVEQPIASGDVRDLAAIREWSPVPIAADESVASVAAARDLLEAGAADVLVVKPARVGGPEAAWEIASLAAAEGVPVVISTLFETGIGITAALATAAGLPLAAGAADDHAHGLATADLLESDLVRRSLSIVGGRILLPEGSGLGLDIDEPALRRYSVEWLRSRP